MDVRMLSRIRARGQAWLAEIRRPNRLGKTSVAWAAAWATTVLVAAVVGVAAVGHRRIGLALGALVLTLGIFAADPILLVVLALPGSILIQRLGGSTNFSAADLLAFVGGMVALFHIRWSQARYLRQFLSGVIWYQAILILVVIAHPNRYNIVEWVHRFSYLGATVLCGWAIATYGRTRQAFRLFLGGASLLAVLAIEHSITSHFHPAQWSGYQKNTVGAVMWVAIVVAQVNPPWSGVSRFQARITKYLCLLGLLASQSRQSAILMVLALGVAFLLNPEFRARAKLIALGSVPVILLLYYSFSTAARNNPRFNSVSIREGQFSLAIHVWHLSPIFGEGMRFYDLPQWLYVTAPPNVIIDNLASTGIIGSVAFVFLVWVTVRTMIRLPYALGTLGLCLLIGHYVDGLFDIFWIGGPSGAPYIICGISLGMADLDLVQRKKADLASASSEATSAGTVTGSTGVGWRRTVSLSIRDGLLRTTGAMTRAIPAR
jgi:polysaccharide biosynthesis protein PslJ